MKPPKQLSEWVTFIPNKTEPVHNWFYYKEGFSKKLVDFLIHEFDLTGPVLDPFCGVGTTLLACKQRGLDSIGMDVSPLAVLASRVKTRNYNLKELEKKFGEFEALEVQSIEKIPLDPRIRKLFYREALETIWVLKTEIEKIGDSDVRDFFLLALIDTAGRAANVEKVGGSLRKTKKPNVPVKKLFLKKALQMIEDLRSARMPENEPQVILGDSRFDRLEPGSVNAIITSPPYLNKIEYTKVYKLELAIFFGFQQPGLRAFVGDESKKSFDAQFAHFPIVAQAYFSDLLRVFKNWFEALSSKGIICVNVAGGCLPEGTVNSPQIVSKLLAQTGFVRVADLECRKIKCVSPVGRRIGDTTENVLVFQKP